MSELNNPIRYSFTDNEVDLDEFDVDFVHMILRPDEGNIYLYWEE